LSLQGHRVNPRDHNHLSPSSIRRARIPENQGSADALRRSAVAASTSDVVEINTVYKAKNCALAKETIASRKQQRIRNSQQLQKMLLALGSGNFRSSEAPSLPSTSR
jgi:hypothetical protein